MTGQSQPGVTWKPRPFLHGALFVFTALLGIEAGAGAFVTVVVFPVWASSPEAAIGFTPGSLHYLEEGDFFMFASPSVTLLALITLIAGWRAAPPLRLWLRMATLMFLVVFVWSMAYFVPVQDVALKGAAGAQWPRDVLAGKLQAFVGLNYIRQAMLLFSFGAALHALGLSYRMTGKSER